MSEYTFKVNKEILTSHDCFKEASKEELRVLIALICTKEPASAEQLSEIAGVSVARTKSAITLFEECGVIVKADNDVAFGEVVYEFENKIKRGERVAETAMEAARSIRDNDLYELQRECEKLLGKTLSTYEIGNLTSLCTGDGLSPQYILLLTAHLCESRSSVKISTITRTADGLLKKGIDTLEELERYIEEKNKEA